MVTNSPLTTSTNPTHGQAGNINLTSLTSNFQPPISVTVGLNAIPVTSKLLQRAVWGEFIDMAEFLPEILKGATDDASSSKESAKSKTKKRKVNNLLQWVECFNAYISLVATKHPNKVSDLLAYSSLMVLGARNFEGDGWIQYDWYFRKSVAFNPHAKWGEIQPMFWSLAFANARTKEHCAICFSLDHTTVECEEYEQPPERTLSRKRSNDEACRQWNYSTCPRQPNCYFLHVCISCRGNHKFNDCPTMKTPRFNSFRPHGDKFSQGKSGKGSK